MLFSFFSFSFDKVLTLQVLYTGMFYGCVWTDIVDLTSSTYEKSFEMCLCLWQSSVILRWPCVVDRMLNPTPNKHFQFVKHFGILFVPLCSYWQLWIICSVLSVHLSFMFWVILDWFWMNYKMRKCSLIFTFVFIKVLWKQIKQEHILQRIWQHTWLSVCVCVWCCCCCC